MKSVFLILLCLSSASFSGMILQKGYGKAPVGANQTEDDVEAFALLRAQSDAMTKLGSYVESNLQVRKTESLGKTTEATSLTLRRLAVGMIQMVEGSKKVRKSIDENQITLVEVEANFQIDEDDFKKSIDAIVSQKIGTEEVQRQIDKFGEAENDLLEITQSENIGNEGLKGKIENYTATQNRLSNSIKLLNGEAILGNLGTQKNQRVEQLKQYLTNIGNIGSPSKIWTMRIIGNPKIEDISESAAKVSLEIEFEENQKTLDLLDKNYRNFENALYTQETRAPRGSHTKDPDYVTCKIAGDPTNLISQKKILWYPMAVIFKNNQNQSIAYATMGGTKNIYMLGGYVLLYKNNSYGEETGTAWLGTYGCCHDSKRATGIKFTIGLVVDKRIIRSTTAVKAAFINPVCQERRSNGSNTIPCYTAFNDQEEVVPVQGFGYGQYLKSSESDRIVSVLNGIHMTDANFPVSVRNKFYKGDPELTEEKFKAQLSGLISHLE